jgi:hypothetical protein
MPAVPVGRMGVRHMPNDRTITYDVRCAGCGYNLRTLSADGVCPECSLPIRRTLSGAAIAGTSADYRRLTLCCRGIAVVLLVSALLAAAAESFAPPNVDLCFMALAAALGTLFWLSSGISRGPNEPRAFPTLRYVTRVTAPAALVTAIIWHVGYAHIAQEHPAAAIARRAAVLPGLLVVPSIAHETFFLSRLCQALGPPTASFARPLFNLSVAWWIAGVGVLVTTAHFLAGIERRPAYPVGEALSLIMGIGVITGVIAALYTCLLLGWRIPAAITLRSRLADPPPAER